MAKIRSKLTGDVFEAFTQDFTNEPDFEIVDDSTPVTTQAPNDSISGGGIVIQAATDSTSGTTDGSVDTPSVTNTGPVASDVVPNVVAGAAAIPAGSDASATPTVGGDTSGASDVGNTPAALSPSTSAGAGTADASSMASGAAGVGSANIDPNGSTVAITDPSVSATPASVDGSVVADPNAQSPAASSVVDSGTTQAATQQTSSVSAPAGAVAGDAGNVAPVVGDGSPATGAAPVAGGDLGNAVASTDLSAAAGAAPSTVSSTSSANSDATAALMSNQSAWSTPGTLNASGKHIVATQLESDVLFAIAQIVTPTDSIKHAADAFFAMVNSQIDVEAVA